MLLLKAIFFYSLFKFKEDYFLKSSRLNQIVLKSMTNYKLDLLDEAKF